MNSSQIHTDVGADYPDYLRDESRSTGKADGIFFAESEADICHLLQHLPSENTPVTVQGGRTGITAGAVPDGGIILNLSRMNRIIEARRNENGSILLEVEPGLLLEDLRKAVSEGSILDNSAREEQSVEKRDTSAPYFFPPDPTETTASIGGMTACNASGALSFRYGPTRNHIHGLRVVLINGDILDLQRGRQFAKGNRISLQTTEDKTFKFEVPALKMPSVKHAAGYYTAEGMDAIDLFIGAEGTLGIITRIDCRLIRRPSHIWGAVIFLPDESAATALMKTIRNAECRPAAIEYFSAEIIELLRKHKQAQPSFEDIPELPSATVTALYVEYHNLDDVAQEATMEYLLEQMERYGADGEQAWVATDLREMERLKAFRHAAPECVNLLIDQRRKEEPHLTKLGTDLAVPDESLEIMLRRYREDLQAAGLEFVIFGHIGDNHLHVNILPRNMKEYQTGRELYLDWAGYAVKLGGSVSAEHGIGKLKRQMLEIMYGKTGIAAMREMKRVFDPQLQLNRGTLFPA